MVSAAHTHPAEQDGRRRGAATAARHDGIQVLRAAAALLVLFSHASMLAPAPPGAFEPAAMESWAIGVDLFFVVSGFAIAASADRPGVTAAGFLQGRAARVLPLYLLASLPYLATAPTDGRQLWNTLLFLPALDAAAYTQPAHPFGWTLALEAWFYLFFAAVVRGAPAAARVPALAAVAAAFVAGGALADATVGDAWLLPRFVGTPMALEFAAGALLHRYRAALGSSAGAAATLALAGAAALLCTAAATPELADHLATVADPAFGLRRAIVWGVPAILTAMGVVALDRSGFRWPAWAVALGDRSFSLYLLQPFAIDALHLVAWPRLQAAWMALLLANLALAWSGHRWIERPSIGWLRARLGVPKWGISPPNGAAPPRAA